MDEAAQAGPSVPRKPRHRSQKTAAAAAVVAVTAPAAEAGAHHGMDIDGSGEPSARAGSSKPRHRRKHKEKQADEAEHEGAGSVHGQAQQAQGAVQANGGEGKKSRRRRKAQQGEGGAGGDVWECHPLAQGNVSRIPPVWSPDGRFYITADSRSIHIHSPSPPYALLSTLSSTHAKGHTKPITALLLSPTAPNSQLITAGEDGKIKVWDYVKGDLVYSMDVNPEGKVGHMCVAKVGEEWVVFGTISVLKKGKGKGAAESQYQQRVIRLSLPTRTNPTPSKHIIGRLSAPPTALFVAPSSLYLIATAGNKAYTYLLPAAFPSAPPSAGTAAAAEDERASMLQCVKFISDNSLTCGAFAPRDKLALANVKGKSGEDWFATGDERGVIRLWHGLSRAFALLNTSTPSAAQPAKDNSFGAERKLPTTSLHWHAHAVAALAFTPSGSQLLSVGEESVLVQWHLASGKREYIPRLGGRPIVSLAVREGRRGQEEEWFVALEDGGRMKVGASSGSIAAVGQGVRLDPLTSASPNRPYPLALHPPTSSLVLPSSHPSTLQFVDPARSTVLFDLEVAPSNRVNRRDVQQLEGVVVEHVAFSEAVGGRSEWMATVEGREGDEYEGSGGVRVMKIWRWEVQAQASSQGQGQGNGQGQGQGRYMVNTTQPRPHGLEKITALQFSKVEKEGERPYLVSADAKGGVKMWSVKQSKKSEHGKTAAKKAPTYELYWTQRSSWTYRALPVHSAAFSRDGTILALAHGAVVSLWDTESNTLLTSLSSTLAAADPAADAGVKELLFVGDEGRYLVGAGKGLIAWDLFSCEPAWTLKSDAPYAHLCAHPAGFTAVSSVLDTSIVSLYSAESSKALSEHRVNGHSFRSVLRLASASGLGNGNGIGKTATPSATLSFVGVTTAGDIVKFGDASTPLPRLSASLHGKQHEGEDGPGGKRSIWQEMFGDRAFALHNIAGNAEAGPSGSGESQLQSRKPLVERKIQGRASAVFDGPSHTLPPVSTLFDAFIDEVLALPVVGHAGQVEDAAEAEQSAGTMDIDYTDDVDMDAAAAATSASLAAGSATMPTHGRRRDAEHEMREMESFFKQILSVTPPDVEKGEKKRKGKAKAREAEVEAERDVDVDANAEAAAVAPDGTSSKLSQRERKKARASLLASGGDKEEQDDEAGREVVVETAGKGEGGARRERVRKRKAPRESAGEQ